MDSTLDPLNRIAADMSVFFGPTTRPRFEFPELFPLSDEPPAYDPPQVLWPECDSTATAEACAELAQSISWRLPANRAAILGFSSPGDGDGTTSLLLDLAPEMAKLTTGGVLVVDANFHKPDLASRLDISAGRTPLGSGLICPTNVPRLSVLPASAQQAGWIEDLREDWPLVLVDMGSLEHVEAANLIRRCDGVCLVVRLGHTARRAVSEAARLVRRCGGQLLGCVVVE